MFLSVHYFVIYFQEICNLERKYSETFIGSTLSGAACSDMPYHHFVVVVLGFFLEFWGDTITTAGQKVLHPEVSKTLRGLSTYLTKIGWRLCFSTEKQDLLKVWGSCSAFSILLICKLLSTPTTHIGRWFVIYVLHLNYQQTTRLSWLPRPCTCLRHARNSLHHCTSLSCVPWFLHMLKQVPNMYWLLSECTHRSAET